VTVDAGSGGAEGGSVSIAAGSGAFLGDFNLTNGITVRVGQTGCR
jgi:hypothetical protein